MKALTVRQPWASLLALGIKDTENRAAGTEHRGPLAIHVSQAFDGAGARDFTVRKALARSTDPAIPRELFAGTWGQVIAIVELVDVHPADGTCCSAWGWWHVPGPRGAEPALRVARHWRIANPRPLPTPIPARGALGLWELDDALLPAGVIA